MSITRNSKGAALLTALERAFASRDVATRKAIVFTESRRTQDYLLRLLQETPYADGVVLFNGTNNDARSRAVYEEWVRRHAGTDRVTGSRTADMRSALVDFFRGPGSIMIATEAGAEGINLQFCSLVVNYDLPWNPQRIEQRIGRCHRYGQKHDVVVVNFLNRKNEADRRVFELLDLKFRLFEGVFGASDEVLGAVESGVDFEKRIARIYQECRTPDEIRDSFARLQAELSGQIDEAMTATRRKLLENFDEEVHDKLRVARTESEGFRGKYEKMLLRLTSHELAGRARFSDAGDAFDLLESPCSDEAPPGRYLLPRTPGEGHLYRLGHPLARRLLRHALSRPLPPAEVVFDAAGALPRVGALEPYRGRSGELLFCVLAVESEGQAEDHHLVCAIADGGDVLPDGVAEKFFSLAAAGTTPVPPFEPDARLLAEVERRRADEMRKISERNGRLFEEEAEKLEAWADDLKLGLEREIKELDRLLREARRTAGATLEEKLAVQREVRRLESERNDKRRRLFDAQDEIERRRDALIEGVQAKLRQSVTLSQVMAIRWRLA